MLDKAKELVEKGQIEEAIHYLKSLKESANHEDLLMIADLYIQWGFLEEANEIIIELIELYPDEGQLYIYAAEIAIEQDYEGDALDYLEEVHENDPAYLQALVIMADMLQMQGLDEAAEQKLLQAKKLAPHEALIDLGLGQFYTDIGEYYQAIPYFQKLLANDEDIGEVNLHILLADALMHTGEFEDALVHYEEGLQEKVEINALFNYAMMAFQLERYELAIAKWNELKELDPEYIPLYLYLAKAYEHEAALVESYRTVQQGLDIDSTNKELLVYAGKMAMKLQKTEEVEGFLQKAIEIDPGYIEAINLLSSYFLHNEEFENVVDILSNANLNDEYDPQFDWDLAVAKRELEQYKDALNHYENAYTSFKENPQFLEDFGYFLLENGNQERAKQMFKQLLEIDPTNDIVEEELNRLEEW